MTSNDYNHGFPAIERFIYHLIFIIASLIGFIYTTMNYDNSNLSFKIVGYGISILFLILGILISYSLVITIDKCLT